MSKNDENYLDYLPSDLMHELKSKNMVSFIVGACSCNEIVISLFENQKWATMISEWGSVVGLHLSSSFDRSPLTDETGTKVWNGVLSDITPVNGFKWADDWDLLVDFPHTTDEQGFQYARSWSAFSDPAKTYAMGGKLTTVRRRRWKRKMIVDIEPASKATSPYELVVKVKSGKFTGMRSSEKLEAYVQTYFAGSLYDTTLSDVPVWNRVIRKPLISLDPLLHIQFAVHKKRWGAPGFELKGTAQLILRELLSSINKGVIEREFELNTEELDGKSGRKLFVEFELKETKLFMVRKAKSRGDHITSSAFAPESQWPLSKALESKIAVLDNDHNTLISTVRNALQESQGSLNELDIFDVINDINQLQFDYEEAAAATEPCKTSRTSRSRNDRGETTISSSGVTIYPYGRYCFSKTVLVSPIQETQETLVKFNALLNREREIAVLNELMFANQPAHSSIYNLTYEGHLISDCSLAASVDSAGTVANGNNGGGSVSSGAYTQWFDISIHCTSAAPYDIYFSSYYEYLYTLREISKIQSAGMRGGGSHFNTSLPKYTVKAKLYWVSYVYVDIVLTINHEKGYFSLLLDPHNELYNSNSHSSSSSSANKHNSNNNNNNNAQRKATVSLVKGGSKGPSNAREQAEVSAALERFKPIYVSFSHIDSIDVNFSNHLSWKYIVEVKIIYASSTHLKRAHDNCYIEVDTSDGQHFQTSINPDRHVMMPHDDQGSAVVAFNESFRILVPQSVMEEKYFEDYIFFTFHCDHSLKSNNNNNNNGSGGGNGYCGGGDWSPSGRPSSMSKRSSTASFNTSLGGGAFSLAAAAGAQPTVVKEKKKSLFSFSSSSSSSSSSTSKDLVHSVNNLSSGSSGSTGGDGNGLAAKSVCSNVGLSLSSLRPSAEGDAQCHLLFDCTVRPYVLKICIERIESLVALDGTDHVNPYFILYVVDCEGKILKPRVPVPHSKDKGYYFKSKEIHRSFNPYYNEEIEISAVVNDLTTAKYVLVEVWDKNSKASDVCLGEVYMPLLSAVNLNKAAPTNTSTRAYSLQLSQWMKPKSYQSAPESDPVKLGTLHAQMTTYNISSSRSSSNNNNSSSSSNSGSTANTSVSSSQASLSRATSSGSGAEKIDVTIVSTVKKIASQDCAWPCRFVTKVYGGFGDGVFHIYFGFDGLHIHGSELCKLKSVVASSGSDSKQQQQQQQQQCFYTLLEECLERVSEIGDKSLHLIVPYSRLREDDIFILTDSMVMFSVVLRRVLPGISVSVPAGGRNNNSNNNAKDITLDLVIGPCVAADFFTTLHYRITLAPIRDSIGSFVGTQQTDSIVFDQVVKLLQSEIHSAMKAIMLSTFQNGQKVGAAGDRTSGIGGGGGGSSSGSGGGSHLSVGSKVVNQGMLACNWRQSISHRLLVYRHAILKLYFWYLMEFSAALQLTEHEQEFTTEYIEQLCVDASKLLNVSSASSWMDDGESKSTVAGVTSNAMSIRGGSVLGSNENSSLVDRIAHILQTLESNVRSLMYQSHKRNAPDVESLLDTMIYEQYKLVVAYIENNLAVNNPGNRPTIARMRSSSAVGRIASPAKALDQSSLLTAEQSLSSQKKGDLIRFIIAEDQTFEKYLHSTLLSNGYEFSIPPLLSLCFDLDRLIGIFSDLLNENIQLWNTRTLRHFFTHREAPKGNYGAIESGDSREDFTLWDIDAIRDAKSKKELYISNIPETIQMQLNVQIGLKKIQVQSHVSAKSRNLIYKMNEQISGAVAKSYLGLASEYERAVESLSAMLDKQRGKASVGEKDDLMCFLMSIMNDCQRVIMEHIPESEASFLEEFEPGEFDAEDGEHDSTFDELDGAITAVNNVGGGVDNRGSLKLTEKLSRFMVSNASSMENDRLVKRDAIKFLFANATYAMEAVCKTAVNQLSNHIYFHSDMRSYFLQGFDTYMIVEAPKSFFRNITSRNSSLFRGSSYQNSSFSDNADSDKKKVGDGSPVETISASLTDFFLFVIKHLHDVDVEKLAYICVKKLAIRYLMFLRDLLLKVKSGVYTKQAAPPPSAAAATVIENRYDGGRASLAIPERGLPASDRDAPDFYDSEEEEEEDPNNESQDYFTSSAAALPSSSVGGTGGAQKTAQRVIETNDDCVFSSDHVGRLKRDVSSIIEFYTKITSLLPKTRNSSMSAKDVHERKFNFAAEDYQHATSVLFNCLSTVVMYISVGEITVAKLVENVIYNQFSIKPPPYSNDPVHYPLALEGILKLNSTFIELSVDESIAERSASKYSVIFSELSAIKLDNCKKNSFVRINFDGKIKDTVIKENSAQIDWDEMVVFEEAQDYKNKIVTVQLVEFRMRALKLFRETVLGTVTFNLSEIMQASNTGTGSSDVAAMAALDTSSASAIGGPISSPSRASGPSMRRGVSFAGNTTSSASAAPVVPGCTVVANQVGWFIVDCPGTKAASSAATTATSSSTGGVDNSQSAMNSSSNVSANSFVNILSSDKPRTNTDAPQLRLHITIAKEMILQTCDF